MLDLSPTPTLLRANKDGGAVRGAIPEKIPIPIPIPGFIMYRKTLVKTQALICTKSKNTLLLHKKGFLEAKNSLTHHQDKIIND